MRTLATGKAVHRSLWRKVAWTFVSSAVICAFSAYMYYAFAMKARDLAGGSIATLFFLLGAMSLHSSLRMALDGRKLGAISLTPPSMPAYPGGVFSAILIFHHRILDIHRINAQLRCIRCDFAQGVKSVYLAETVEHAMDGSFSVRIGEHDGRAEIRLAILRNAPATDLPGERAGEPGPARIAGTSFHRWEIDVSTKFAGLDLEWNFPVIVDPAPASLLVDPRAGQSCNGKPEVIDSRTGDDARDPAPVASVEPKKASPYLIHRIAFWGTVLLAPWVPWLFPPSDAAVGHPAPVATEQPRPRAAEPAIAWTENTQSWAMPIPPTAVTLGIAIKSARAARRDGHDRIEIDEILLEMHPGTPAVSYSDILLYIAYVPDDVADNRLLGDVKQLLANSSGTLTAERPVVHLREIVVTVPPEEVKSRRVKLRAVVNASNGSRPSRRESSGTLYLEPN